MALIVCTIVALSLVAASAARLSAAGRDAPGARRDTETVFSGSVAGSYELGAANTDSSDPFNDYAIEGEVPFDVGGVGLLGYANGAKSYAVYGVTFGANGIGVYGAGDGPTPAPNATPSTSQQSTGVVGDSHSGQGVFGSTEFPNDSDSLINPAAGVLGVDNATTTVDNVGVAGETSYGDFGAIGLGGSGAIGGVAGSGDVGVAGFSFDDGTNFPTAAAGSFYGQYTSIYGQAGTASGDTNVTYPLYLADSNQAPLFYVDNSGDTYVEGELFLHDGMGTFARTRDASTDAQAFVPTDSEPTIEDVGRARLASGRAYVRLDAAFGASIDLRKPYMVFVTPEGDTNGVFVTGQSRSGFAVHENHGGRSNVDFVYRIVADRVDAGGRRISLVESNAARFRAPVGHSATFEAKFTRVLGEFRAHQLLRTMRPATNHAVERR